MASYTEISTEDASSILSLYGKGKVKSLFPLSLGISNSNYKVVLENDEVVLLKISNDKNKQQLSQEQEILVYLNEIGYPYSLRPYALKTGESVYEYGQYFGVVFPFAAGIPPGPSDFTCEEVGRAIAKLHTLQHKNEKLNSLRGHEVVGFGPLEILVYTKTQTCPEDFKKALSDLIPDELHGFIHADFEKGIIHGDLYYDNTLFDQNKIKTVLDFEQAGVGEYLLDLGISISGTCLEKGRIITPLVNSYLKGYESVRPLSPLEKEFLDQSIILGLLSISLWRIKRFKEGNLNPLMENSYQDLLVRAYHYNEMRKQEK